MDDVFYLKLKRDEAKKNLLELVAFFVVGICLFLFLYFAWSSSGVFDNGQIFIMLLFLIPFPYGLKFSWSRILVFSLDLWFLVVCYYVIKFFIAILAGFIMLPINAIVYTCQLKKYNNELRQYESY